MENRNSSIFRASCLILISALLLITGCATSPEVKLASSEMTQAINEYDQNVSRFQDLWIAEIDKSIDDLGKAIVVRAVRKQIKSISTKSGNFSNEEWQKRFQNKGMIALSEEIEHTQDSARNYLSKLKKEKLDEAGAETVIKKINGEMIEEALKTIETLEASLTADQIQKAKDAIIKSQNEFLDDPIINSYSQQIIDWRVLKQLVPKNLKNLENVIQALKTSHQTVDGWIQTDVTVSGEEVGGLVSKHSDILGL